MCVSGPSIPGTVEAGSFVAVFFEPVGDGARGLVFATGSCHQVLAPEGLEFAVMFFARRAVGAFTAGLFGAIPLVVRITCTCVATVTLFLDVTLFARLRTWVVGAIPCTVSVAGAAIVRWRLYISRRT